MSVHVPVPSATPPPRTGSRRLTLAALWLAGGSILGCAAPEETPLEGPSSEVASDALKVADVGGRFLIWPRERQRALRWCMPRLGDPNAFPTAAFDQIVRGVTRSAARRWSNAADLRFVEVNKARCSPTDAEVDFTVQFDPNEPPGHAEAFFLDRPKAARTIRLGPQNTGPDANYSLQMLHEFGHGLGFLHEEESGFPLTSFDSTSIMAANNGRDSLSSLDQRGVQRTYGIPMEPLGFNTPSAPAISSRGPGRLDIFARGHDNRLHWKSFGPGGWSGWQSLGGSISAAPAAVSWSANRIDVFARGTAGDLVHTWYDGTSWRGWDSMGGQIVPGSTVAVTTWGAGRLDVFVQDTNNGLHQWWYENGPKGWVNLGGSLRSGPAAISRGVGRIDVVAQGPNGEIVHRPYSNGWQTWRTPRQSNVAGGVALAANLSNPGFTVYARTAVGSGSLLAIPFDGTFWQPTQNLSGMNGGLVGSGPSITSWGSARLDLVTRSVTGEVEHAFRDSADSQWKVESN